MPENFMKTKKRKLVHFRDPIFFMLLIFTVVCLSCHQQPPKSRTVIIGLSGDIDSLNELNAVDADAVQIIQHLLFMTLTRLDEHLEFTPYLAKRWEFSNENKILTFHLRNDIVWSDSVTTTAEDVLFTYETMIDSAVAYPGASRFDLVQSVKKINDFTIQFELEHAYADALFDLQFPILPAHILRGTTPKALLTSDFNRKPVTNGPFLLEKWEANEALYFQANKAFAPGAPGIDRLIFSILPEPTTRITNLLTHNIDLLPRIPQEGLTDLAGDKTILMTHFASKKFSFIGWNCANPLFNQKVRRALTHAIDKDEITNTLFQGYARPAVGPLTPMAWAYDRNLRDINFDPAASVRLLKQEGWTDSNGDGRLDKDGRDFAFSLSISNSRQDENVALLVQAQLQKIGVYVTIKQLDMNLFIDQVVMQRQFDAAVMTLESDFTVNPTPLWHSKAVNGGFNFVSYKNPQIDSLLEHALNAPDRKSAMPIWKEFQQIIIDDCPYTFLFIPDDIVAWNKKIENAQFDIRGFLATVQNWRINEN